MARGHDRPCMKERLQSFNISDKNVLARITLPFSTKYKTDMTMHCLLKALQQPLNPEDELEFQNEAAEADESSGLIAKNDKWEAPPTKKSFSLDTFFSLYHCHFQRAAPLLFYHLRNRIFGIEEEAYQAEFTKKLRPVKSLGFSGSLFFFSDDKSLIVKSIGRKFEHEFLYTTFMNPLANYYNQHPDTLLSHITDVLYSFDYRLGDILGISPSHYIVMENALQGLDTKKGCKKWDLKPQNFFEPTRDLVPDDMKSEAAKSGLADKLDEEIVLTRWQKQELMFLLERDTAFLEDMETIDYSLLLGRYPVEMFHGSRFDSGGHSIYCCYEEYKIAPTKKTRDALGFDDSGSFMRGVRSADGKWVYKMCILDFFWNAQQLQPRLIRAVGKALPEQTVTTDPKRYRKEFLRMMDRYITIVEDICMR